MAKDISVSVDNLLIGTPYEGRKVTVGVALSGGRDSVALFHCLKTAGVNVVAINVEHGIRGEESVRDSEFVAKLCGANGVQLYSYSVNAPAFASSNGYTLEQAARELRYRIFDGLLKEGKCDLIALAHHRDDQVETVFMRMLRGTGIRGLCGMRKVNGRYIRPLLDYSREDIDVYVKKHGLVYVDDSTNDDTAYTRNFLRGEIAVLKKRYPAMDEAVARLCDSACEAEDFIESHTPEIVILNDKACVGIKDCGNSLIFKRLVYKAACALGVTQDIEEKHYALVRELLNAQNGKYLNLTHGLSVHKEGEYLVFIVADDEQNKPSDTDETEFGEGVFEKLGVSVQSVDAAFIDLDFEEDGLLYADVDKIPAGAVIRGRRDGDYIRKFGGGTKSLGDFLTDKKVPLRVRDELKVVADGNRILAVFGVDISADVKIDENTSRVYTLSAINNF